ncbi:MAG TPA: hydrolase [Ignavibacteriaceae bacterium]|nr:hydrolase [Ignavibacteriaceae bacterium]
MSYQLKKNKKILDRVKTALLIIDIQERILSVMQNPDRVVSNTIKLIKGFKVLNSPIYYTEQYPKGLGSTFSEIKTELDNLSAIQKMSFSCFGAENLFMEFKSKNIGQLVIAGIEGHVCVQQTVLDLLANNFQVNLAADAVSSRNQFDYEIAINRMESHGAEITTTEAILFEMLNYSGTDEFKLISKIIK